MVDEKIVIDQQFVRDVYQTHVKARATWKALCAMLEANGRQDLLENATSLKPL